MVDTINIIGGLCKLRDTSGSFVVYSIYDVLMIVLYRCCAARMLLKFRVSVGCNLKCVQDRTPT